MIQATHTKKINDKLGRPLRDLRVSVTDQCFLRCFYCMPKEIFGESHRFMKQAELLSYNELERLIRAFALCGVEKIRLTGGEPLLRPGLSDFIESISGVIGIEDIALTTNALLLEKYLPELKRAGLHRLNISLDAMDDEVLRKITGKNIHARQVLDAIESACVIGFPVKVNMVVARGVNEDQILPMSRYMKERGIVLRFIEYMDVGNVNGWQKSQVISGKEIRDIITQEFALESVESAYVGEVARRYRYADCGTEVGFIESISKPFCGDCNRARISATGKLFTCLFSNLGFDLKKWLRDDGANEYELADKISRIWVARRNRYSEERFSKKDEAVVAPKAEMWQMGG